MYNPFENDPHMAKSVFSIREQVEQRGHYCSITFDVDEVPSAESKLLIEYYGDATWETICRSGAHLFFEYYSKYKRANITVKFIDVRWMPVDTQAITVRFVTIKGLSENLGIVIDDLYFDRQKQCYSIPDPRVMLNG